MASLTDAQILDVPPGQRSDLFTLELLNTDRTPLGTVLRARADSSPSVQVNTNRTTFRTASGLIIEDPPTGLDLKRTRVRPVMTLTNGSRFECGVLMFGTDARTIYTAGELWVPQLFDETFLLQQALPVTWTLQAGKSVLGMFEAMAGEVLEPLGVPTDYRVPDVLAANVVAFKVGSPRIAALLALAALLGALPPYFANSGAHTLKPPPILGDATDHVYSAGTRIFDGTTTTTSSEYKAPNRYIVVGDDVGGAAVRGVYDLPAAAPNSYFNTGQRITKDPVHVASGVSSVVLANQIAYVDALTDRTTYDTAEMTAAADPRHDIFDTVTLLDIAYIESGHTLNLQGGDGAGHSHSVTRMWS